MANRRMFSLDIVNTDSFLDMSSSAQALYSYFGMRADDDGSIASPKRITNMVGCNADDLKLLIAKGFVIQFSSGIVVITHWKINNYLRPDRYRPTLHQSEKAMLESNESGYNLPTVGIPVADKMEIQDSIEIEVSKDKDSKGKNKKASKCDKIYFPNDESLNQAFLDYLEMRKQIKKPMTDRAIKLVIKKLEELSALPFSNSMDNDLAIQILNQSVMNSWQGLFPLKKQKTGSTPQGGVDWSKV